MADDLSIEDRMAQLMASYDDEDDDDTPSPEDEQEEPEASASDPGTTPAPQGDWWDEIESTLPEGVTQQDRAALKDKVTRERDRVAGTLGQRMQSLQNEYNVLSQRLAAQPQQQPQSSEPSEADDIPQETADLLADVILRSKHGSRLREVMDNHVPREEVELRTSITNLSQGQYKDVPEFAKFIPAIAQVIRQHRYNYQDPAVTQTLAPLFEHLNSLVARPAPAKTPARRVRGVEQPGPSGGRSLSGLPNHTDDMGEILDLVVKHV